MPNPKRPRSSSHYARATLNSEEGERKSSLPSAHAPASPVIERARVMASQPPPGRAGPTAPASPASRMGKLVWTKTHRPSRRDCSVCFPILCPLKVDRNSLTPAIRTGSPCAYTATLVCPQAPRSERERAHECLHRGNTAAKSLHPGRKVGSASVRSAARHHPPPLHGVRSECSSRPCSEVLPTGELRPAGPGVPAYLVAGVDRRRRSCKKAVLAGGRGLDSGCALRRRVL